MKWNLLHIRYEEKTSVSELWMSSLSLSQKQKQKTTLTPTNALKIGQVRAQFLHSSAFPIFLLVSSLTFVVLAYVNYKDQISGTLTNAQEFRPGP